MAPFEACFALLMRDFFTNPRPKPKLNPKFPNPNLFPLAVEGLLHIAYNCLFASAVTHARTHHRANISPHTSLFTAAGAHLGEFTKPACPLPLALDFGILSVPAGSSELEPPIRVRVRELRVRVSFRVSVGVNLSLYLSQVPAPWHSTEQVLPIQMKLELRQRPSPARHN